MTSTICSGGDALSEAVRESPVRTELTLPARSPRFVQRIEADGPADTDTIFLASDGTKPD
jgi:hypothetical protein